MRICLITEGSYPYVIGGVSSWVNALIGNFPQHEFILYCIGAKEADRGKYLYDIHDNTTEIKEIFLDEFLKEKGKYGKRYKINAMHTKIISDMLCGENIDWHEFFICIRNIGFKNVSEFFMSKSFFDIIKQVYDNKYAHMPFTEYFWTIRSMLLPLFNLLVQDIPKADIYHSVATGYAGIIASLGSTLYNKPFLLTEHGIYSREREEEIIKADWVKGYLKDIWIDFFNLLGNCSYDCACKVVSLFEKNRQIEIDIGCDKEKTMIIHNGIDVNKYKDITLKQPDDEYINIGAIIRVVPIKDIKTMIEAFSYVKRQISNARFYIMGPIDEDPEYYEECQSLVDVLEVEDIIFTGRVNIKDYLGKMDILVLTSISEGQPLAILEGLACKKPFVTTNVGSCKELLYGNDEDSYGLAGLVVPVMDYEEIGKAVVKLCNNEELREQMGQNGYERVSNFYTHDMFIDQYDKLYNRLVEEWQE